MACSVSDATSSSCDGLVAMCVSSAVWTCRGLDLSRFDAAPLIAFTATKETDYGTETDERIPQGCGAYRADQRADTQTGG
ncbi:hypothetical protein OAC22_01025 [bacterium]|nr:hypothetical protein [bacterium]